MHTMIRIQSEIVRLIEKLHFHDSKVSPSVHSTDLIVFDDQKEELIDFIQSFSVLKKEENIRQILQWKHNMIFGEEAGLPLSGIDKNSADLLYNSVFSQHRFIKHLESSPVNIVLFRRGTSGEQLTNILKSILNINITILLSATDDSRSWFYAAREFKITGIPSAGKALVALATDRQAKEFFMERLIITDGQKGDTHYKALIDRLSKPSNTNIQLNNDSTRRAFIKAMNMNVKKRQKVLEYLKAFYKEYENLSDTALLEFTFNDIAFRSYIILGAYYYFKEKRNIDKPNWQDVLDEIAHEILGVKENNKVILMTNERQHIVALDEIGNICFSELAIKELSRYNNFLGIWLLDMEVNSTFINSVTDTLWRSYDCPVEIPKIPDLAENKFKKQFEETVRKVDPKFCKIVARLFDGMCTSITAEENKQKIFISEAANNALTNADLILYSDDFLETSVGGALIVPGAEEAISDLAINRNKLKVCLTRENLFNKNSIHYLESIFRYITGRMKYEESDPNWENIEKYVDYIVQLTDKCDDIGKLIDLQNITSNKVFTQYIESNISPKHGFFPEKSLSEIILSLIGIYRAGFIIDQNYGLVYKKFIKNPTLPENIITASLGLFRNNSTKLLVNRSRRDFRSKAVSGGFVFDVDLTLLPKRAEHLTDFPELAFLIMQLLRDQYRVGIISGNSEEEQIPRIVDAIRKEMNDDISGLKNLTFYVDGGATKISYDAKGVKKQCKEYNEKNAMDYSELKDAVNKALKDINDLKDSFFLNQKEQSLFMHEVYDKYAKEYNLIAPWERKADWEPAWIRPDELEEYKIQNKELVIPWIEMRGKRTGIDRIASIAIKPTPSFRNIDIRDKLQNQIRKNLKNHTNYNIRSGGRTTTDITRKEADKTAALLDFIKSNKLKKENVYYFGDEFYYRTSNNQIQIGNDEVVAIHPELRSVNTLAVNFDDMEGADPKTIWIGRSPQAVLEFLEEIIPL
jgi:hydroxymethylpyrimidine pyrophosphatase-like HAD family hydrolase